MNKLTYEELLKQNAALEKRVKELETLINIRKGDAALIPAEQIYQTLFQLSPSAIGITRYEDGTIYDASEAYSDMSGYSREEMIGKTTVEINLWVNPNDREKVKTLLTRDGGYRNLEMTFRKRDNSLMTVLQSAEIVTIGDKRFIIGTNLDITKRKKAEEDLMAEKERLAVTLRSIGDAVIATDINGQIILMNKIAEDLTGWKHEEAISKPINEIFNIVNEMTGKKAENPIQKVLEKGMVVGLANHTILIAKDGTQKSIADSGAPIRDKNNHIIGVVLVFRDVTYQQRIEKELVKNQRLESVGILAGGIAHDFNNLLAAMLGNLSLIDLSTNDNDEILKLIKNAEKACFRARDLTQQLLTFSKGGSPVKKSGQPE